METIALPGSLQTCSDISLVHYIKIKLDGQEFEAHEIQASVLVQPAEDFPITSPLIIHIAPTSPSIYEKYWRQWLEGGEEGVTFKELTFQSVKHGGDNTVTTVVNPVLKNAGRDAGFLTFFVDNYSIVEL